MVALSDTSRAYIKGLLPMLLLGCAVAAFGLTLHFFGYSEQVPPPSQQFGFFALFPVAIIDRVYEVFTGIRFIWSPLLMFLVLLASYFSASLLIAYKVLQLRSAH